MTRQVFYSWQSDVPNRIGRKLIEKSLKDAIKALNDDVDLELPNRDIKLDSDTKDVAGMPPIFDVLVEKIENATAFVADLTSVANRSLDGALIPNPNVCIEYGVAYRELGWSRVIAVMNVAKGDPAKQKMPFDLGHLRHPITFDCPDDASDEKIREVRKDLTKKLTSALKVVFAKAGPEVTPNAADDVAELIAASDEQFRALLFQLSSGELPQIVRLPRLSIRIVPEASLYSPKLNAATIDDQLSHYDQAEGLPYRVRSSRNQWWISSQERRPEPHFNPETDLRVRIARPGLIETQLKIAARVQDDPSISLHGIRLEDTILRHFEIMLEIVRNLGFTGRACALVSLEGLEDVELLPGGSGHFKFPIPQLYAPVIVIADMSAPLAEPLQEAIDVIWQSAGRPTGSPSWAAVSRNR